MQNEKREASRIKWPTQRLKLLTLLQIFERDSDSEHWLTSERLLELLDANGVVLERRALYNAIDDLQLAGYDIRQRRKGNITEYSLVSREFELAEVKLLIALVQSSKFLTDRKSRDLITKLRKLTSHAQAESIHNGLQAYGRVKSMNESIYRNIDILNTALKTRKKVRFLYYKYDCRRQKQYHNGGEYYSVSPYLLVSQNDKVYLAGYDENAGMVKNFRVDKIEDLRISKLPAVMVDCMARSDPSEYIASMFNMFGGKEIVQARLRCDQKIANVILDNFGDNIIMTPQNDGTFLIRVSVSPSNQFYGWVVGLYPNVTILDPPTLVEGFQTFLRQLDEIWLQE